MLDSIIRFDRKSAIGCAVVIVAIGLLLAWSHYVLFRREEPVIDITSPDGRLRLEFIARGSRFGERKVLFTASQEGRQIASDVEIYWEDFLDSSYLQKYPFQTWVDPSVLVLYGPEPRLPDQNFIRVHNDSGRVVRTLVIKTWCYQATYWQGQVIAIGLEPGREIRLPLPPTQCHFEVRGSFEGSETEFMSNHTGTSTRGGSYVRLIIGADGTQVVEDSSDSGSLPPTKSSP